MVDNTRDVPCKRLRNRDGIIICKLSVVSLLLFTSTFCSTALYSQQADSEKRDLKVYKVKRATSLKYSYDSDDHENVPTKSSSEYDTNGNLAKRIEYSRDGTGKPPVEWTDKYDPNNSVIESALDGHAQEAAMYKYGPASRVIAATRLDPGHHVKDRTTYTYDGSGKLMINGLRRMCGVHVPLVSNEVSALFIETVVVLGSRILQEVHGTEYQEEMT